MRGTSKRNHICWSALLIAIAFLGHDVLMAGDAHAQPEAATGPVEYRVDSHHVAISDASHGTVALDEHATSTVPHDAEIDGCSTLRSFVQRPVDPVPYRTTCDATSLAMPICGTPLPIHEYWREPTAPPGTIRALLQVYLI